jgi:hypothetical protein
MKFSIGEYVRRKMDGKVGVVKSVQPWHEGGFAYSVDLDPSRPSNEDVWSGTEAAWEPAFKIHAHVSTRSRDCDGDYSGGSMYELTLEERCDQFGDLHFKERVMASIVSLHGHGTLTVDSDTGISWHEDTEEGYREAEALWCESDCGEERPWQRDHRAEAAGY